MTLKMLIVDDEPLICEGLSRTIPWNDLNIEVIGTAQNGKQAIEIIEEKKIDIVITDVHMPELDGIGLSRIIAKNHPEIRIVIISGYDEFEYARQAIRIGVKDYLLKPVDIDELLQLIEKVKLDIEQSRKKEIDNEETLLLHYLTQQLFHLIDRQQLDKKLNLQVYEYQLMLIERKAYMDHQMNHEEWKEKIRQVLVSNEVAFVLMKMHENQLLVLFFDQNNLDKVQLGQITEKLPEMRDMNMLIGLSSFYRDLTNVRSVYNALIDRLDFFRGTHRQIVTETEKIDRNQHYQINEKVITALGEQLFQSDEAMLEEITEQLFNEFTENCLTLEQMIEQLQEVLRQLKERGEHTMLEQVELGVDKHIDSLIYNSVPALKTLLIEDLERLKSCVRQLNQNHRIIHQAKQYIEENYQKDIKAIEVAEAHFITPNYFSLLFKQETGCNYSEYLNTIRINKAKALLLDTPNKVFEIAEYVGYREYKYFVQVFKNFVGMTPTQYRRIHCVKK